MLIMKTTRNWLKYGIVGTLLLTMACSAALILQVLTSQSNIKAGIATFRVSDSTCIYYQAPNNRNIV